MTIAVDWDVKNKIKPKTKKMIRFQTVCKCYKQTKKVAACKERVKHTRVTIGTATANSAKSDHGCTPRIFFDNAGNNVTLTL